MISNLLQREWVAAELQHEATSAIRLAISHGLTIALYGAGQTGRLVASALQGKATLFIDDTPEKAGQVIDDLPVLNQALAFEKYGSNLLVIVCIFSAKHQFSATHQKLKQHFGWDVCPFFQALLLTDQQLPNLYLDQISRQVALRSDYEILFKTLADKRSQEVLLEQLNIRLLADFSVGVDRRNDLGFLQLPTNQALTYVDAGAFDGDTIQEFIGWSQGHFEKIFGLEPDSANFAKMQSRLAPFQALYPDKIELFPSALWSQAGFVSFSETQSVGSAISKEGATRVATKTLADFYDVTGPLLIKIDIEGAELEVIFSSLDFIKAKRPILAISVYHQPNDLIDLFKLIQSLDCHYSFFLRCHGGDGTDLMLYCNPGPVSTPSPLQYIKREIAN